MKYILYILSIITISLWSTSFLQAQDRIYDEAKARSIFEDVDNRRNSLQTETSEMNMVITDSRGRTRSRTMQSWAKNDDDKTYNLIVFSDPGNVRGTGFFSVREDESTMQRLFLPSLGRIQTISSGEKSDRFMGSDFTYEDLGDQNPDNYQFEWLEDHNEYYLVRASKPASNQYSYIEFEILKDKYALQRIHYYNSAGDKIKRLEAREFNRVTDDLWSPSKMVMFDLLEDRHTELSWSNRQINIPIEDWRFTERGLKRGI